MSSNTNDTMTNYFTTCINGVINKISYCALSIVMDDIPKVLYLQKYPPMNGTSAPNFSSPSSDSELTMDNIRKETFVSFWNSNDSVQVNGNWKGGKWGKNNLVTTDSGWLSGAYIGDKLLIKPIKQGIIKMNGGNGFTDDMPVIPGYDSSVWSCNVEYNGKTYGVYLTDNIMPQYANDVLFIWKNNSGTKFIKLLTRANNDNVDMPLRMMPGAGEHMEPGKDIKVKAGILRAVNEEIGIAPDTLTKCYLIDMGEYSSSGRDPRYWTYSTIEDDKPVTFGMERGSITHAYILYLSGNSDTEPNEVNPLDTQEVNYKWWAKLDTVLTDYSDDRWMIKDHQKFIPDAIKILNEFDKKTLDEKEVKQFNLS